MNAQDKVKAEFVGKLEKFCTIEEIARAYRKNIHDVNVAMIREMTAKTVFYLKTLTKYNGNWDDQENIPKLTKALEKTINRGLHVDNILNWWNCVGCVLFYQKRGHPIEIRDLKDHYHLVVFSFKNSKHQGWLKAIDIETLAPIITFSREDALRIKALSKEELREDWRKEVASNYEDLCKKVGAKSVKIQTVLTQTS